MNKKLNNIDSQLNFLMRGAADVISEKELVSKLKKSAKEKKPLRIKLGVDASASDIHLGTTVPLYKLKQFQELGHQVIFLIGDFTGMIGNPFHFRSQSHNKTVAVIKQFLTFNYRIIQFN